MAGSQNNYWGQHDLNRMCFGLGVHREYNLKELQQQQAAKDCNALPASISFYQTSFYSDTYCLTSDNTRLAHEGDQVVPSFQRGGVCEGHQREAKPLPPLPDPEELMSDEAADSEVEFFTSDRQHLLPKSYLTTINRDCGQVNYAYKDAAAGIGSVTFSWPSRADRVTDRGCWYGGINWSFTFQREDHVEDGSGDKDSDQQLSSRMRFSSTTACPSDKPEIPPRIPIPSKPPANTSEEDQLPKIPPRVPLVPPCPPRTPSPKSLPIYINGVMPATQSFAANPKYVSKALQRQQSERTPALAQVSPCIVPILKDGRQASNTHYILLPPGRPTHSDRRERIRSEPGRTGSGGVGQRR